MPLIWDPRPLEIPDEIDPPPTLEEDVFLPAITAGTSLFDSGLDLIASWSRTVSRPTFYEWVPTRSLELSTGLIRNGNPLLENSRITNYDLSATLNLDEDSLVRIGLFRKTIQDPIIETRGEVAGEPAINYNNGLEGVIQGVELEGEFGGLGPMSLKANVTYIDAELLYLDSLGDQILRERFPYQPNLILNLNLGYDNEEWGIGANVIYNFTGEYLTTIRTDIADSNLKLAAQHTFDVVLRKEFDVFAGGTFNVVAGVKNLFATDKEFTFSGGPSDGTLYRSDARERAYFVEGNLEF